MTTNIQLPAAKPGKKCIVLLSGGLDSTTCLALAKDAGYEIYALSFRYGQRSSVELEKAQAIAKQFHVKAHKIFALDLTQFGGSALTDDSIEVPTGGTEGIPVTYVPARNTLFLSAALGYAEVLGCADIIIGVNAVDYSGYPDCRPEYIDAFQKMANLASKQAVEGERMRIHTPLIHATKAEIIASGLRLGVDYRHTVSCYQADETGAACGKCDACLLRAKGFAAAGVEDVTRYRHIAS